jgi:hypothetical protein
MSGMAMLANSEDPMPQVITPYLMTNDRRPFFLSRCILSLLMAFSHFHSGSISSYVSIRSIRAWHSYRAPAHVEAINAKKMNAMAINPAFIAPKAAIKDAAERRSRIQKEVLMSLQR